VFVGNISATCSADDLHGLFSTFGRVLDCDKVKGKAQNLLSTDIIIFFCLFVWLWLKYALVKVK